MTSDTPFYPYPHLRAASFRSLEIGHATNSVLTNGADSSAYLIFSTPSAANVQSPTPQDTWFSVIADAAHKDPC